MTAGRESRTTIHTAEAPRAIGPYSQAIATETMVYTAGQIGINPDTGELVEGGISAQTSQVLTNLRNVLEAAGASLTAVVKTTVFLSDMKDFAAMNEVYGQFFSSEPPARSTVAAAGLPKAALVEIEATAVLRPRGA
jgi:2-iminobutanoate/2-iminopropanoate deaminase